MQKNTNHQFDKKDEVDLRELFHTIGHYKWSIIFFTILITSIVTVKVYFMPKYYKSTVTIEVKPENDKAGGFSMDGAAAMLLGGASGGDTNLKKDITLLQTYRINSKVLDVIDDYMIRYFIKDKKHKELELDSNQAIKVTDITINTYKRYGMRLTIKPLNFTQYQLSLVGSIKDEKLGNYHYSELVEHEDFNFMIHKERDFNNTYTIELAGTKRHVFQEIISKNLSIEENKEAPFITLSFFDNLPQRGEAYLKNLIEIYTKQSISDIKSDSQLIIDSFDEQLRRVEEKVTKSSKKLESFKRKNNFLSIDLQASALVEELSNVDIEIAQNKYKQDLIGNLIKFAKNNKNIDAIAPSLVDFKDLPTMELIKLIQEQEILLSDLLVKYKPEHPKIVRADQTIYNLKSKVVSNLQNLQLTLREKTKSLKNMEKNYIKKLNTAPRQEQEFISFSRNYEVNEKMYLYLMQERSSSQIMQDKALSRFRIIEAIYTSDRASKPKKALIVIVTFISVLILMIFIAFFREFMRKDK
jgi:uncharacterized protein involved in exopolysaccharide biosynthesis